MSKLKPINFVPKESWLTFIEQTVKTAPDNRTRNQRGLKQIMSKALYKCKCGNIVELCTSKVKNLHTRSCGCYQKENPTIKHGYYYHPLYKSFYNIIKRCYHLDNVAYHDYGGRGVKICDEWLNNPISFVEWGIKNGWKKGLHLDKDKKAIELGIPATIYSPDMCQFLTVKENGSYKRNNRLITFNGMTKTLANWAEYTGINSSTINQRLKKGWSLEKVFTKKIGKNEQNE